MKSHTLNWFCNTYLKLFHAWDVELRMFRAPTFIFLLSPSLSPEIFVLPPSVSSIDNAFSVFSRWPIAISCLPSFQAPQGSQSKSGLRVVPRVVGGLVGPALPWKLPILLDGWDLQSRYKRKNLPKPRFFSHCWWLLPFGCIKPLKMRKKLPTSTGDRRISEPSTVWVLKYWPKDVGLETHLFLFRTWVTLYISSI